MIETKRISYFVFRDALVISDDTTTVTVPKADPRYAEILEKITTNQLQSIGDLTGAVDTKKLKNLLGL